MEPLYKPEITRRGICLTLAFVSMFFAVWTWQGLSYFKKLGVSHTVKGELLDVVHGFENGRLYANPTPLHIITINTQSKPRRFRIRYAVWPAANEPFWNLQSQSGMPVSADYYQHTLGGPLNLISIRASNGNVLVSRQDLERNQRINMFALLLLAVIFWLGARRSNAAPEGR